jgi:filamentous hemagglutinin family protein
MNMWRAKFSYILLYGISLVSFYSSSVLAQTVPDHTLGSESSTVIRDVTVKDKSADLIEAGATRGNNLFHSFSEFNVGDGSAVFFANPDGIANILTRVTGNNPSKIFGTLGVDGAANLFLLNPNGIVFGENAALDVNGSFLATTADSYIFENGFTYSASNPNSPPLLTINLPVGLQFGSKAEAITVRGTGHNISRDPETFEPTWDTRSKGLEVSSGNTLALIGGEINLEGGNLTASQGRTELASIAAKGNVLLISTDNGFSLDGRENDNFKDINLTQSASIDTSGNGSGNIQLQGKNISLLDSSTIITRTLGDDNGEEVKINATNSLNIAGTNGAFFSSGIVDNVEAGATGNASNLKIDVDNLQIKDGGQISSATIGNGKGGNIEIAAKNIEIFGYDAEGVSSSLLSVSGGSGQGGNITIKADKFVTRDAAFISAYTDGSGKGGNVEIAAKNIEILNIDANGIPSGLSTATYSSGQGGNITIKADKLVTTNGAFISASTVAGSGKGGNIEIAAKNIEIFGANPDVVPSNISTVTYTSGQSGNITIKADKLVIRDEAFIDASTYESGNAGNIEIDVRQLELTDNAGYILTATAGSGDAGKLVIRASESVYISGTGLVPISDLELELFSSGLYASVEPGATGNGGSLIVETGNLTISEGAKIVANTLGQGDAGDIIIHAKDLEIRDATINKIGTRSGIKSTVELEGNGNGGNVDIITDNLRLVDGGLISVDALGKGNAGNIKIRSQSIDVSGVSSGKAIFSIPQEQLPSSISAFSQGDFAAGSININTDTLNISDRGDISVSNLGNGNSGNLNITAKELNLDHSATLEAKVNAGSQGNINLTTDNIFLSNYSEINVLATGKATGGNIKIANSENMVVTKNSRILANAIQGKGGNIEIMTQGYFVSGNSLVSASSEFGLDGNINVENINGDRLLELDQLPDNLVDRTQQIAKSCGGGTNQFAIAGRGGLPENPLQNLRGQTVWQDLRLTAIDSSNSNSEIKADTPAKLILEAQSWKINDLGRIELIAINADAPRLDNRVSCQ